MSDGVEDVPTGPTDTSPETAPDAAGKPHPDPGRPAGGRDRKDDGGEGADDVHGDRPAS
jgi:hypothetical protein